MVVVDANEEAMAKLDLLVADDAERKRRATEDAEDGDVEAARESSNAHWRYSAAERPCPSGRFELNMTQNGRAEFDGFDVALRVYLARIDPEIVIPDEQIIQVCLQTRGMDQHRLSSDTSFPGRPHQLSVQDGLVASA